MLAYMLKRRCNSVIKTIKKVMKKIKTIKIMEENQHKNIFE